MPGSPNTIESDTDYPKKGRCRRVRGDRRVSIERRTDPRSQASGAKRSLKRWIRSVTKPRIGVDRRKGGDRRSFRTQNDANLTSLLTPEELADLLK
ncbi:MAG: hypothetical protein HKP41_20935 [Desulfobacterales bacterium]|nr:hypothetical protein [Desulfobacterales bacterium]